MSRFLDRFRGSSRARRAAIRHRRAIYPAVEACEPRALLSLAGLVAPSYVVDHAAGRVDPLGLFGGAVGYTPAQIRQAYGFNLIAFNQGTIPGDGRGQTIAIVDPYDDPAFVDSSSPSFSTSDLARFDQAVGLPNPPSFTKYNEAGQTTGLPGTDTIDPLGTFNWEGVEALDVEWAHAIAPGASIDLIEASSSKLGDLLAGVETAQTLPGVTVVSMSWGGSESGAGLDGDFSHPGVAFVASAGDNGVLLYPAASPNVLGVAGTALKLNADNSYASETVWNDGGPPSETAGGPDPNDPGKPGPDVASNGDPNTPCAVYDSYNNVPGSGYGDNGPWQFGYGTSIAAPQWAALLAIADQGRALEGLRPLDSSVVPLVHSLPNSDFHQNIGGSITNTTGTFSGSAVYGMGSPIANRLMGGFNANGAPVVIPALIAPVEGQALTSVPVATFTDPNGNHLTTQYSATISWGDGATSTGVITGPNSQGVYTVSGTHTYAEESPGEALQVTVSDGYAGGAISGSASTTIGVKDPAVIPTGGFTIAAVAGSLSASQQVATFADPSGAESLGDYTVTINWGDGQSSAGSIVEAGGVFAVLGSHQYANPGTYTVTTSIGHDSAPAATATSATVVASVVLGVSSTAANGVYTTGARIPISVTFDATEAVTGTPELMLDDGGVATYSSGSGTATLTFTYAVASGQDANPLDEASAAALVLNGGTITDNLGHVANLALPAPGRTGALGVNKDIVVDTTLPAVTGVTSTPASGDYTVGAPFTIQVGFNEPVFVNGAPTLALDDGGVATYRGGSGTNTLTFAYTVAAGQDTGRLDEQGTGALGAGGSIVDADGLAANLTLPAYGAAGSLGVDSDIVIDTTAPAVNGVSAWATPGELITMGTITIEVSFTKVVYVTGTPVLGLNDGGVATYDPNKYGGSGTSVLAFDYPIVPGQTASPLDELSTAALSLNGGTIRDAPGNAANLTLSAPGAPGSLGATDGITVDTINPMVQAIYAAPNSGTYGTGATIDIEVIFNKNMAVSGTPVLQLNDGGIATYSSGSGASALIFAYAVAAGQDTARLDEASTGALVGTIKDTYGLQVPIAVPVPGAAGSLGADTDITIDTPLPAVTAVTSSSPNGLYGPEETIAITVSFDKPVNVTGAPYLVLNDGGIAYYAGGSGTSTLAFADTVGVSQSVNRLDEAYVGALILNAGTIKDGMGVAANLTLPAPGAAGSLGANTNIRINPVAADWNYVNAIYEKVLGRSAFADPSSGYWVNLLESLEQQGDTPDAARSAVASGIVHSSEGLGDVVKHLYSTILGRAADPGGLSYFTNQMLAGATEEQVAAELASSGEFLGDAGNTIGGFVSLLYTRILGRAADPGGYNYWVGYLQQNPGAFYQVACDLVTGTEYRTDQVGLLYDGLLSRTGSAAEVASWVNSGMDLLSIEAAIASSREFYDDAAGT
jgi:hypothetical protein